MSRLKLIQAGVGGHGKGWATATVPSSSDFEHVAIVDVNRAVLDEVGGKIGLAPDRRFTELSHALAAVQADALLTVTPPTAHLEHAKLAFAAGLHVMTEKPIADTIASAKEMLRLADSAGRQLVVAQNYRYAAAPHRIRALIDQQRVGALGHGHIDFYIPADFTGSFREPMRHVLLVDMAIHHLDLLRYITRRNVVEVFAQTFRPEWSWYAHNPGLKMMLKLEGDVHFSYSGDWSARGRNTGWSGDWRVQCEQGSIHWNFDKLTVARSSRGFKEDTMIEEVPLQPIDLEGQPGLLKTFATAIRSNQPAPTSGRDNIQSFGAVMAAVKSAETGKIVNVNALIGKR